MTARPRKIDSCWISSRAPRQIAACARIAMFDPKGVTAGLFRRLGIEFTEIDAGTSLQGYAMLIIGREAISRSGALPDISGVTEGLKVLVFEQSHEALTERLGFRSNVHGIRQVFVRVDSHPALQGIGETNLHDWRGAATLTPPYLDVPEGETHDPTWRWCGFENTRVWRCGNHGNVASVLIEKPPVGDFLPILDCGFDLQYSPLLECVEGKGRIMFCQLDVSGRTEDDPAAAAICRNLVRYLEGARAAPPRQVVYAGGSQGEEVLKQLRVGYARRGSQPLGDNSLGGGRTGCGGAGRRGRGRQRAPICSALGSRRVILRSCCRAASWWKRARPCPRLSRISAMPRWLAYRMPSCTGGRPGSAWRPSSRIAPSRTKPSALHHRQRNGRALPGGARGCSTT